jgi:hypothetical protein
VIHWKFLAILCLVTACASINGEKNVEQPPKIHSGMPVDEIISSAVTFGGQTLEDSAKVLKKQNLLAKASLLVQLKIIDQYRDWAGPQLINAVKLYQLTTPKDPTEIFRLLINSERKIAIELALQIASEFPSAMMAKALDTRLTVAIEEDELYDFLLPQLAIAITRNNMKGSYSILKLGLFQTNHDSFVLAMTSIDPQQASIDFLDYISQVPVEELRQLALVTLDVFSCIGALKHLIQTPPPVSHPKFDHLFLFAMSRNTAFAELSRNVILTYLPRHSKLLARRFSQLPNWIQVAYIEGSRERLNPTMGLFLQDLRRLSAQKEIVEEIDSIKM